MHKLSIIVPCYNEERTVEELLHRVARAPLPGWEREIIVVDDGSTDGTRGILRALTLPVKVILQDKNGGKGTAVRRGLQDATGDYALIQDADLEYDPQEIRHLLEPIDRGEAAVVYGSRALRKQRGRIALRFGVWVLTQIINVLWRLRLTDACTCYKLFPLAAKDAVAAGGFESDILLGPALARAGYGIVEVPISYTPRSVAEGKKIRYRDGLRAIIMLILDKIRNG